MLQTKELKNYNLKSLCRQYEKYFYIGAAVDADSLGHYRRIFDKHFNCITPENEMKFAVVHPEEDRFDWSGADAIISYASENHMAVRGYTLIWHEQMPNWVFGGGKKKVSREAAPNASLFFNEYNGNLKEKQEKIYTLIKKMQSDNIPIDGIGYIIISV